MSITETARAFVEACDGGKGWDGCAQFCHADASFSCQADTLAEIATVEGYTAWVRDLFGPIPDNHCELKVLATDEAKAAVSAFAVFKGTQTGPGPVDPPTGRSISADYVYVLQFEGDRIRHMTKIWNDVHSLKQLGWA